MPRPPDFQNRVKLIVQAAKAAGHWKKLESAETFLQGLIDELEVCLMTVREQRILEQEKDAE